MLFIFKLPCKIIEFNLISKPTFRFYKHRPKIVSNRFGLPNFRINKWILQRGKLRKQFPYPQKALLTTLFLSE